MSAIVGNGIGFTLPRMTRRFVSELAISVCASLAVTVILACGAPTWPSRSPASLQAKLTARADPDPQMATFMESVALSHVGPERAPAQLRPIAEAKAQRAALAPEKTKPVRAWRDSPQVALPPRPAELSVAAPAAAPSSRSKVFGLEAELLGGLAKALPSRAVLFAKVDSIGARVTGLFQEIR